MERPFRKLRMASSIASLLVALVSLNGTYALVTDSLLPLMNDGNGFTAYGWGVIVAIAARVAVTGLLVGRSPASLARSRYRSRGDPTAARFRSSAPS